MFWVPACSPAAACCSMRPSAFFLGTADRSPDPHCPPARPRSSRLNLGVAPLLEKNLEFLNDCLDDLMVEQGKLSMCAAGGGGKWGRGGRRGEGAMPAVGPACVSTCQSC